MSDMSDQNIFDSFESHPNKRLVDHTEGVYQGVKRRTHLAISHLAAKLHDVGKINPNFQLKLKPGARLPPKAYSSHAYLSALTFLSIPKDSQASLFQLTKLQSFSIAMLIALHHGNLRNASVLRDVADRVTLHLRKVLCEDEYNKASKFILDSPDVPFMQFASYLLGTELPFPLKPSEHKSVLKTTLKEHEALEFFIETQFAFASLIESDKRDAGNNQEDRRENGISVLHEALKRACEAPIHTSVPFTPKTQYLNQIRAEIRQHAIHEIQEALSLDERVFYLPAPTGAGKTMTLLAMSEVILHYRNVEASDGPAIKGIIYSLPFLSITEQVEKICRNMLPDELVLRADSAAHNPDMDKLIKRADEDPTWLQDLLREDFAEQTFDSPLVITTFVQFFETLMSNRNRTLLKLPNFARSVIIIDEVQALPPRLYVFFAAYLDTFCRKFDSYVIYATATMPRLSLPKDSLQVKPSQVFTSYKDHPPRQLISEEYFRKECFNRYDVTPCWEITSLEMLATEVTKEFEVSKNIMVVLNTIKDTRQLHHLLESIPGAKVELLNTEFIPLDRLAKIERCRTLSNDEPLIMITTQLVEAGVDIDFPMVFRDLCPFPSLIQTAGRCNRNDKFDRRGTIKLVDIKTNGKSRAELIYLAEMDNWYLEFTRNEVITTLSEQELYELSSKFFEQINANLRFGDHPKLREPREESNLLHCIRDAAFEDAGKFRLIQEQGEMFSIYVPDSQADDAFEKLGRLASELWDAKKSRNFQATTKKKLEIERHLRWMRQRIVQKRLLAEERKIYCSSDPIFGIYKLGDDRNYTSKYGLEVARDASFF